MQLRRTMIIECYKGGNNELPQHDIFDVSNKRFQWWRNHFSSRGNRASDHEGQSVLYKSGLLNKTTCKDRLVCSPETFREYYSEFPHCCCSESLRIKPIAGRAILFFPRGVNGEGDKRTWHGLPYNKWNQIYGTTMDTSDEIVHKGGIETAENDVLGLIDSRNKENSRNSERRKGNMQNPKEMRTYKRKMIYDGN